jgi:ABC-type multidrug transport system permease subunit
VNELVRAGAAIVRRDARVFFSYRLRPVRELVGTVFTVALFYELAQLVSTTEFPTPSAYFEFAAVGLALTPMLRVGLVAPPAALREELLTGTFERLALSPLGASACLLATLAFPLAIGMASGAVILALAGTVFGLGLAWPSALLAPGVAILTALALAPFGALLLAAGMLAKQASAGSGWIVAGLALLGGVYFPPDLLPDWINWGAEVQPVTPALDLLRHVLTGSDIGAPLPAVAKLAAFALIGLPLAAGMLGAAVSRARRRGTLLEY